MKISLVRKAYTKIAAALAVIAAVFAFASPSFSSPGNRHILQSLQSEAPDSNLTLALVDPVPALLNGAQVTTNYNALATNGRIVKGAGADGVTEIVVRFAVPQAGQQYTITLLNDQGVQSTSVLENGGLGQIGSTDFSQSQVNVSSVNTSSGPMAFLIYQAPIDFPRPEGQDANATSRIVTIEAQSTAASGQSVVTLLRPPVALVHGLWGGPSDWNDFAPFLNDPRWNMNRANYSQKIGSHITSYTPTYPPHDVPSILALSTAAALGYAYNAPNVMNQVGNFIFQFRNGSNPAKIQVAAEQADFVDHSMGGLVTRWMAQLPNFLNNYTFGQGIVHKVVTIGSPHIGSPLATDLLQTANTCSRNLLALTGSVTFDTASLFGENTTGAVNDLQGDGFGGGLSNALEQLQNPSPHPYPFALIVGLASQNQFNSLNTSPTAIFLRLTCAGDPIADHLAGSGWEQLFGQPGDAIVPELSANNNGYFATTVNGVVHSDGTVLLGFGPPAELDAAGGIPNVVITLLNTNLTESTYVHF